MNKRASLFWGFLLIFFGGLALVYNFASPWLPQFFLLLPWRLWPLAVIGLGLCFVLPPLFPRRGNLGGLFIPGLPILAVGTILLFNNWFDAWGTWAWLWPVVILALAVGFLLAAWRLRVIWLLIPAIIIGANGLLMQVCTLTGNWSLWAILWGIEPLAVGLSLLLVNLQKHTPGLLIAGLILCGIAGFATMGMSFIIPGSLWTNLFGPSLILLVGLLLMLNSLTKNTQQQVSIEQ
jgi:hypothetical protein